jgi:hypothetical protein
LVHELIHQYFYGLLASDEQMEAFLDEGFTSFWDAQYMTSRFGAAAAVGTVAGRPIDPWLARAARVAAQRHLIEEPLRKQPSAAFYPGTERTQVYLRGAQSLKTAGALFGAATLGQVFRAYYQRYRFRHPTAEDFLATAGEIGGAPLADFLREAFRQPRIPDFEVVQLEARRYRAPLGRVVVGNRPLTLTAEEPRSRPLEGLDWGLRDEEGKIWIQVIDPGWLKGAAAREGAVRTLGLVPRGRRAPRGGPGVRYYESRARIRGPGWDNLPVEVLLRFADGVEVVDRWDGRAAWRGYRVVRRAVLREIQIDPGRRAAVDVLPQNNARRLEPDARFTLDWCGWLTAIVQWAAGSLSLWM